MTNFNSQEKKLSKAPRLDKCCGLVITEAGTCLAFNLFFILTKLVMELKSRSFINWMNVQGFHSRR